MRVTLEPAYILHTRPFGDTSLLIDLLTLNHGRLHALARNARGTRSRFKGILQPFIPFLASWSGKTELMYLNKMELSDKPYYLKNITLICGVYLNELLVRLLHREDSHPNLYLAYQTTLAALQEDKNPEIALRIFEKQLLSEIGYGVQLDRDAAASPILPEQTYMWHPERGFLSSTIRNSQSSFLFSGKNLLALHNHHLESIEDLRAAKRLMWLLLTPLLGGKPIRSRELL